MDTQETTEDFGTLNKLSQRRKQITENRVVYTDWPINRHISASVQRNKSFTCRSRLTWNIWWTSDLCQPAYTDDKHCSILHKTCNKFLPYALLKNRFLVYARTDTTYSLGLKQSIGRTDNISPKQLNFIYLFQLLKYIHLKETKQIAKHIFCTYMERWLTSQQYLRTYTPVNPVPHLCTCLAI